MRKQLIITSDGSHSFYIKELDEQYHSKHGAIKESMHIFIDEGLFKVAEDKPTIDVLEIGMGTGLNVFLTYIASVKKGIKIKMTTIEAFPIEEKEVYQLNYPELLRESKEIFHKIHSCKWNEWKAITGGFSLIKYNKMIQDMNFESKFDIIYFDAFAPEKQEEMWTENIFRKLFACLSSGGILVTYCVKGVVRRRVQKIGFNIEKIPGPKGGKREMLRARKRDNS